jgi:mRNA interferase YafQ
MREYVANKKFDAQWLRARARGLDIEDWDDFVYRLLKYDLLPPEFDEHLLHGPWKGLWECHLAPDLLVIYRRTPNAIILKAIGTHKELFKNQPQPYHKTPKQRPKGFRSWPFSQ